MICALNLAICNKQNANSFRISHLKQTLHFDMNNNIN